jgi:hypothetical protein
MPAPRSTFAVPPSKASHKQNRFEFTLPHRPGESFSIPKLKYLPIRIVSAASAEGADPILAMLDAFGDERTADAVRDLDAEQLEALVEAWQAASGVTVGESSASSDS